MYTYLNIYLYVHLFKYIFICTPICQSRKVEYKRIQFSFDLKVYIYLSKSKTRI